MLSWFKKRKRVKVVEDPDIVEDVTPQEPTTQKQASRKKKEKSPAILESNTVRLNSQP